MKTLPIYITCLIVFCIVLGCTKDNTLNNSEKLKLAGEYLKLQQYSNTLSILNRIDDDKSKTEEYYLIQGISFFKLGDFKRAIISFEMSKPKSIELKIFIAYIYLLSGDMKKAVKLSDTIESQYGKIAENYILKGNISLKSNSLIEAEKYFNFALTLNEKSTKAVLGVANIFFLKRELIKAEEYYVKSVFLSENDINAYIALTNYYIATGRYRDAESNLREAMKIDKHNINVLMSLCNLYIMTNNYHKVAAILKTAREQYPYSVDLYTKITRTYLHLNQLDDAYQIIQILTDNKDDSYYSSLLLGEYYLRKNEFDLALSTFNKIQKENIGSYEINYYIGLIYLIKDKLLLSKQFLEKSIINFPGFTKPHLLLANIYLYQKQYNLASEHSRFVLQLEPDNMSAHVVNGIALYLQGYLNEAKYEFEVVDSFDSTNPIASYFNSLFAVNNENFTQAKEELSKIDFSYIERLFLELEVFKLVRMTGENAEIYLKDYEENNPGFLTFIVIGNFHKDKGAFSKASQCFEKAIAMNEDCIIPYYYLSEIETVQGNLESAITFLHKTIDLNPNFQKSYQALGSLYERIKDYNNARLIYQKGLEYYPDDSTLLNNLAWVYLVYFNEKLSAYPYVRKAITNSPDDVKIRDTLGWWYYCNNDFEQAVSTLKDVVGKNPDNPLYRYHLGMSLFKSNEKQLAVENLQKALELEINDEYKGEILKILEL